MRSLSRLAIERPVMTWMMMFALMIFGVLSYRQLGIGQVPDVDFPVVSVAIGLPGAAPEVIESQILDVVEDSLMQIGGVLNVNSTARQGTGSIAIEFDLGRDIDQAMVDVKNQVEQVLNLLPSGTLPARIRKSNPEDEPILWLALSARDPSVSNLELMAYAKEVLQGQMTMISGVSDVQLGGYANPMLRIEADIGLLQKNDLSPVDLLQAVQSEHFELPSGQIDDGSREVHLRVLSESKSAEELGEILIRKRSSQGVNFKPIRLKDVAKVKEGTADVRRLSRLNGKRAVGLGILKQHGSNAVGVADSVRAKIEELRKTLPKKFDLEIRTDFTRFVRQSVKHLLFTLFVSALLTSIVCFLFLGSWASTFNVLLSIPTSIIGTFIGLYFFQFTLNIFTLLGLTLAIGIVVDDAIMMLENIVRHGSLGKTPKQAAIEGSEEIAFSAVAATVAVAAIFVPVVFMKGIIGRFFLQYGMTVTIAVGISLLEALTLTAMRCSRYLPSFDEKKQGGYAAQVDRLFSWLATGYQRILRLLLRNRWKVLFISVGFFSGSLWLAKKIPSEMMPAQDQSSFVVRLKTPVGTSLQETSDRMKPAEDYLQSLSEVTIIYASVGALWGGDSTSQGQIFVSLIDKSLRKQSQSELIRQVRKELKSRLKGIEVSVQDTSLRGFSATRGYPVEFVIQGSDWKVLTDWTNKIMEQLKEKKILVDVNTDIQKGMSELQIIPNREKLAYHGVSMSTMSSVISTLMGGTLLHRTSQYSIGNNRYEIMLRLGDQDRVSINDVRKILIRNNRGQVIPLPELAEFRESSSLSIISRTNRSRAISVYGNPAPGLSQNEAMKRAEALALEKLPPGYTLKMSGSSQSFKESFNSLLIAMLFGILVSYMVLASQFNSFVHPVTVLLALPFSITGALLALHLTHQSVNMYSMIGFILLLGIVKKNSILLVDYTNQCRAKAGGVTQALLQACPVRLRPILMTSIATIAGTVPEAVSAGPGSEAMIPMAVAIIGGLIASTLLTLFVVPCVYSLLSREK